MNPSGGQNDTKGGGSLFNEGQLNAVNQTGSLQPAGNLEGDNYASMASEEAAMKQRFEAAAGVKTRSRVIKFAALGTALVICLVLVGVRQLRSSNTGSATAADASLRYHNISLPLADLAANSPALSVSKAQTLTINGQLTVNNSLVLAPVARPDGAVTGQLYYDQTTNQLSYYDGSSFQTLLAGNNLVTTTLGGASGAISTGSGLNVTGNTLSNSGVLSLQGQSGNITLAAGPGIVVNGTTLSNSGLLSLGGQNGAITLGAGLSLSGFQLRNTGIISAIGTGDISVTNDGNGNITVSSAGGAGSGTVASPGGTSGKIAKFTGVQTIADSLISDNGTTVTVGGDLSVTGTVSLTTPLAITSGGTGANNAAGARTNLGAAASGANSDITALSGLTTALTVAQGGTGVGTLATNGVILGNGTSPLTSVVAGSAGQCLVSTAGAPIWTTCPGSGGVSSLNGGTGALTLNNASLSGSAITINDATTAAKGIASFNATNFTVASGAVNTVQNINTTASPTFGQLTLTSSQATNPMFVVDNTNLAASGALLDLQLNGSSKFSVSPAGNITSAGTLNGQTISSSANLTGTLAVAGAINGQTISSAANFTGSVAVGATLNVNTITPTGSLTVGATGQSFLLQGNASSTFTATSGASKTTLGFQTPTANVTYNFPTAAAGTYNICTTVGNCAGVGGGVTTPGGTANTIAKFTASGTIGNSSITDNGTTVTVGGTLSVNTITPTSTLTIGATGQNLTLQGASVSLSSTAAGVTNSLTFAAPSGSNKTITIPNATGTLAVSASGPIALDAAGNLTCPTCLTSGGGGGTAGVTSVDGLTGALTLNNSTGSGTNVTINNSKADGSTKGIATFNGTNFTDNGSGVINTVQDIATTAAPTFGQLTITSSQAANAMMVINNTNTLATGNLIDLQLNGASKLSVAPNGNTTIAGTLTSGLINGQTISAAANFAGSVTVGTTLAVNTITPSSSLTVGSAAQSFVLQGNGSSTITSTANGHTTTLGFTGGSPTTDPTYKLDASAATGTYTICTTAGNCVGSGGSVAGTGTNNHIAKFTATGSTIGDSSISDNGSNVTLNTNVNLILQGATAYISNPQGQARSEAFGQGAIVNNNDAVAVGFNASGGNGGVAVGSGAVNTSTAATAVGNGSSAGFLGTALGNSAVADQQGTALGQGADTNGTHQSIALGYRAINTADNQFVVGGDDGAGDGEITQMVVGNGVTNAAPIGFTLQGTSGSGTNIAGASVNIAGGQGTGTGNGGSINLQIAKPGASGSIANVLATVVSISGVDGHATFTNAANSTSAFLVQNASSANILRVDTTNARVGINTFGAPTSTLEITGTLRIDGSVTESFHTPGSNGDGSNGANINTKINIPFFDPGNYGQIVALGLPSSALSTARVLTLLDARITNHQPTINVISPNENENLGFSWDGSNTLPLVKTSVDKLGFSLNGSTPLLLDNSPASLTQLQIGISGPSGKDGALTLANASNNFQVGILTSTTSASYNIKLPAAIGSAGNCLNIASVVGSNATLGYTSCGGGGNAFLQGGNAFGATGVLGTTDNNALSIITNNVTRATFAADGSSLTLGSNTNLILQGSSAHISNPQGQTDSEAFGLGASVTSTSDLAVGKNANVSAPGSVALGTNSAVAGFGHAVALGNSAYSQDFSVAIGDGARIDDDTNTGNGSTSQFAIAIGTSARANSESIALGYGATAASGHQFVVGGDNGGLGSIQQMVVGNGVTDAAPVGFTLQATSGSGTDIAGGSVTIAGGQGTGAGNGGNINFQIAKPGATGTSQNALATVASLSGANGSALFKNSADSTVAFQVQNSSSAALFTVDTTNKQIIIGASAGSGTVLVNNGATVNSTLPLGNFNTGGSIGSAASTVDIYTSISVAQTTANQTLTIPSPTASTTYGHMLYISNIGTANFTFSNTYLTALLNPGATATLIWENVNGTGNWTYSGADGSSILNQNATTQTGNFLISGTGQANTFTANTFSSNNNVTLQAASGSNVTISPGAAGGGSGTLNLAVNAATLNIGNGSNNARSILIGNTAGTQAQTVTIGNSGGTSSVTTIQGSGGVSISANGGASNNVGVTVQTVTNNSTVGFRVQNASGASVLNADTTNGQITIAATAANEGLVIKRSASSTVATNQIKITDSTGSSNLCGINVNANGDAFFCGGNNTYSGTTGENTGVGAATFSAISTGNYNTAVGTAALTNLTTGTGDVGIGVSALNQLTAGQNNTGLGTKTFNGVQLTSGNDGNTAVGASAGYLTQPAVSNFYNNTFVGAGSAGQDNDGFYTLSNIHNSTAIGQNAQVQATNTIVIGSQDATPAQIVIGSTMPTGTNMFGVSAIIDKASGGHTASQATSTITGSGTSWTTSGVKVGMRFIFANGTDAGTITAINSNTSLTVSTSQTVTAQNWRIVNTGFQVTNTGDTYVASTSSTAFQIQSANGTALLSADTTNQRVSIGTGGTAVGQLYLPGTVPTGVLGSVSTTEGGANIVTQGRYAYVLTSSKLRIFDVSRPNAMTSLGSISVASNGDLQVQGKYAYVTNRGGSGNVYAIDISNPSSPVIISTTAIGAGLQDSYTQGRYMYALTTGSVIAYDMANPANPRLVSTFSLGAVTAQNITVQGRYAYVTSDTKFLVIDVSNPASMTQAGSLATTQTYDLTAQGRYVYIGSNGGAEIRAIDVSNPASPTSVGTVATNMNSPITNQRFLYTGTGFGSNSWRIIDISNPASMSIVGTVSTPGAVYATAQLGRYLYALDWSDSNLLSYDLGGEYAQSLEAGNIETGNATVNDQLTVAGSASFQGTASFGSNVNINGDLGISGNSLFQSKTNSTNSFQVQNSAGSSLFNVDSTNNNISLFSGTAPYLSTSWTSTSAINGASPQARYGHTSVVANGYIYVMGGTADSNTLGSYSANTYYAKINADGTISSTWTTGSTLSYASYKAMSFTANGYVYYIGGWDGSNTVGKYSYARLNGDGSLGAWTLVTTNTMPGGGGRSSAGIVYLNGYVYLMGGYDNSTFVNNTIYAKVNADGTLGAWNTATGTFPSGVARTRSTAVAANGYIYLMAGGTDNNNLATGATTVYYVQPNSSTGDISSWSTSSHPLPAGAGLMGATSVVMNGYVYYMGGINTSSVTQTSIYYSQLPSAGGDLGTWNTSTSTLAAARWDASSVAANGYVYEIGGISSTTSTASTSTIYYANTSRVQIAGSLDLVGLQGATLADGGSDQSVGSTGGSITAGNGTFVGALQVQGQATFNQSLTVNGAFTVGNMFSVDLTQERVTIGPSSGDNTGAILVLGVRNATGDPSGTNGAMYYNSSSNTFRCYTNGAWGTCGGATRIRKSADESKSSLTTPSNDSALQFSMEANASYNIRCQIYFSAQATPGFKWDTTGPASPTAVRTQRSTLAPAASAFSDIGLDLNATTARSITGNASPEGSITLDTSWVNGANAGTWAFQWSQSTASITPSIVRAGSYCDYSKM